jgi:tetrathionate reductase subunit C
MNDIIEMVNVTRPPAWLPWAVQYFFLIGLSVTAFGLSLPGFAYRLQSWAQASRLALLGSLTCGLAAPVALLADLHQPGRFWEFYTHPNLHSWMAWGSFFIPGYVAGLLAYTWAVLRPDLATTAGEGMVAQLYRRLAFGTAHLAWLRNAAAIWTVTFGALVLLYTGMEVMVVRARPLWNTPLVPVQFALTALGGAIGLILVLDLFYRVLDRPMAVRLSGFLALVMLCVLGGGVIWLALGLFHLDASTAVALAILSHYGAWQVTAVWAAVAAALPATLYLLAPVRSTWLCGLIALHAAWMFRWTIFIGGQGVPKTGAGLYGYQLPLGPEGLLGIVAVAGLWLFLLIPLAELSPILGPRQFGHGRRLTAGSA